MRPGRVLAQVSATLIILMARCVVERQAESMMTEVAEACRLQDHLEHWSAVVRRVSFATATSSSIRVTTGAVLFRTRRVTAQLITTWPSWPHRAVRLSGASETELLRAHLSHLHGSDVELEPLRSSSRWPRAAPSNSRASWPWPPAPAVPARQLADQPYHASPAASQLLSAERRHAPGRTGTRNTASGRLRA